MHYAFWKIGGYGTFQGEWQSLNDYDGNKANIVPDRARKYWQGVRDGTIKVPHYRPTKSLVGVGGNIGVG
ncbi:unnamed protein product [Strongylus vulgaris]|uniref:Uncharacterized protein n=1 Tax=Strongylus vulgaris TaxID=40348 RepID=A0A3P7KK37_STRVU|nr:unnamed protein product [Strongylus vulgaris]